MAGKFLKLHFTFLICSASASLAQSQSPPSIQRKDPTGILTVEQKFHFYLDNTFNEGLVLWAVVPGALELADPPSKYPPEWRDGLQGFARNTGDYLAFDVTLGTTQFAAGAILKEDPRYFPSHSRNVFYRAVHAIAFTLVDKGDNGERRVAISNLLAASAAGFVGNTYRPRGFNDVVHGGQESVLGIAEIAADNLFEEFKPELKRFARRLHIPAGATFDNDE